MSQLYNRIRNIVFLFFLLSGGFLQNITWANDISTELGWIVPIKGMDILKLKKEIEIQGGSIIELTPEGRLLISYQNPREKELMNISGVELIRIEPDDRMQSVIIAKGLGARRPTPEDGSSCYMLCPGAR